MVQQCSTAHPMEVGLQAHDDSFVWQTTCKIGIGIGLHSWLYKVFVDAVAEIHQTFQTKYSVCARADGVRVPTDLI